MGFQKNSTHTQKSTKLQNKINNSKLLLLMLLSSNQNFRKLFIIFNIFLLIHFNYYY